jgi:hypothetical protein
MAAKTTKRMEELVDEALAADRELEAGGEAYASEGVHAWLAALARGERTPARDLVLERRRSTKPS